MSIRCRPRAAALSKPFTAEKGRDFSVPYRMKERATSDVGAISFGAAVAPGTMSEPPRMHDPQERGAKMNICTNNVYVPGLISGFLEASP